MIMSTALLLQVSELNYMYGQDNNIVNRKTNIGKCHSGFSDWIYSEDGKQLEQRGINVQLMYL